MHSNERTSSAALAQADARPERRTGAPALTEHPAFPVQAMPWQPDSARSPRTHLVPPELLG